MITSALKDKILFYLCENFTPEQFFIAYPSKLLKELEVEFDSFNAVMCQFQRFGLLADLELRQDYASFTLLTEANDYAQKGGFALQEEVFKGNLEKLELEIEYLRKQLGPDKLDNLNKISAIASALFSGLSLLPK